MNKKLERIYKNALIHRRRKVRGRRKKDIEKAFKLISKGLAVHLLSNERWFIL